MSKVLAEVEVPIAQRVFEMFLPVNLTGFEALPLIIKLAGDLTYGMFMAGNETVLCRKEDGSILDLNMPIWKLGIKNGDKLVLI